MELQITTVNVDYRYVLNPHLLKIGDFDPHIFSGLLQSIRSPQESTIPTLLPNGYARISFIYNITRLMSSCSFLQAATQIDYLSADLSKGFLVGGESAGGNLSAVVALKARDDPFFVGRQITGQVLLYPALSHPDSIPDK